MPRVTYFEIHADEPERAIQFYTGVFDWQFDKWDGPQDLWFITTGPSDQPGIDGGLLPRRGAQQGKAISSYICTVSVPSVDAYLETVKAHGGTVAVAKMAIPGEGWLAYARDSEGNIFGLIERSEPQTS